MKQNIVLTGFMGTGKSTVGKHVAGELDMGFIDTDHIIEHEQGMTISEIFSQKGEAYFRELESKVVEKVAQQENMVIATGGGVVLRSENMQNLRKNGIIIRLKADVETILRNTSQNSNRPLLQHGDLRSRIEAILNQREAYYSNNDYEIDVSLLTVEQVVSMIMNIYRKEMEK
ncbi:MAG: shikimate kinase [Petroclostridium sp.]|uniref:shikimate kinase n=1 Tax=Petroclostridium xylanilyticum TaxID=1792311 RepID=UPI000B982752|nr:shikimate kinase [Petroclostridium xylanilyticum]MBZ4644726.1 AroK [Clostridia bacterium]MDK2811464.1 shikimate kinase [Petroclostridium sp.]